MCIYIYNLNHRAWLMWTGKCIIVYFIYFTTCTQSMLVFASVCIQRTPIPMIFNSLKTVL